LDEFILFFSPTRKRKKEAPTHIAHIGKAARANAKTIFCGKRVQRQTCLTMPSKAKISEAKVLSKSAILSTHTDQLDNFILFYEINLYFS
jgi:hypothetical protein